MTDTQSDETESEMARRFRRGHLTALLVIGQVLMAIMHLFPGLVYLRTARTTRLVLYISSLGPVWVVVFGLTSLGLIVALSRQHGLHYAHLMAAGAWVMYDSSLWLGAFGQSPHGTIVFPAVCLGFVSMHALLSASYNEDVRFSHRRGGR